MAIGSILSSCSTASAYKRNISYSFPEEVRLVVDEMTLQKKVRKRAGHDEEVTATGNDLFEMIVKERKLELAFEGQRYWDLIRWGKAQEELSDWLPIR